MGIYALKATQYHDPRRYFYSVQKGQAKSRGIPFELTFEEWWELWEPYWDNRGKGQDNYCMGRYKDEGAYAVGNVSIITCRENRELAILKMPRGCKHSKYKPLDEEAIREDYATGKHSWNTLAKKYSVSKRTIGRVLHKAH